MMTYRGVGNYKSYLIGVRITGTIQMKVGDYEVSDSFPVSVYNRGFLESATWKNKEIEVLQSRIQTLEEQLKAIHDSRETMRSVSVASDQSGQET
jgi:hypothetical protein